MIFDKVCGNKRKYFTLNDFKIVLEKEWYQILFDFICKIQFLRWGNVYTKSKKNDRTAAFFITSTATDLCDFFNCSRDCRKICIWLVISAIWSDGHWDFACSFFQVLMKSAVVPVIWLIVDCIAHQLGEYEFYSYLEEFQPKLT